MVISSTPSCAGSVTRNLLCVLPSIGYRIGQQNPVQVYKLIAQDTIEEKIVELQQAKQDLAETVTGSADGAILRMKPEELLNLLEGTE